MKVGKFQIKAVIKWNVIVKDSIWDKNLSEIHQTIKYLKVRAHSILDKFVLIHKLHELMILKFKKIEIVI